MGEFAVIRSVLHFIRDEVVVNHPVAQRRILDALGALERLERASVGEPPVDMGGTAHGPETVASPRVDVRRGKGNKTVPA